MFINFFREDRFLHAVENYVQKKLNVKTLPTFRQSMEEMIFEADCSRPIIIALSSTSDPASVLLQIFESFKSSAIELNTISMGQGQGLMAEKAIASAAKKGDWIHLSNIHFAGPWILALEHLIEETCSRC